ncbi:MAG: hypothetical protein B1H03_06770 [Planctomycetales bacterium 4484_113]|nr:MAG: hypothetical protein B1H03_06770 [Planctomycetales bacterium 4484_113]
MDAFAAGLTDQIYADGGKIVVEAKHTGLHKSSVMRARGAEEAMERLRGQIHTWWRAWMKAAMKDAAAKLTRQAQDRLGAIDSLLLQSLDKNHGIDWEALKDKEQFGESPPEHPELAEPPQPPSETDRRYDWRNYYRRSLLDLLSRTRRESSISRAKAIAAETLENDNAEWRKKVEAVEKENQARVEQFERERRAWECRRQSFLRRQDEHNKQIDAKRTQYERGEPKAIPEYCRVILSRSEYPEFFPKTHELDYNPENRILVLDYALPPPGDIPRLKEVKYVATRDEFSEVMVSEREANQRYDSILYQVCLRTLYELFVSDEANAIDSIAFNGWVTSIDAATGKEATACILSIHTNKEEFLALDLRNVDPKACFKSLKGVGSSKLHGLSPIAPVIRMDRSDKRFIEGYDVASTLNEAVNVAAIDWQDFEHLIREVFEKEFSSGGGEVKITRASRDRGVDAIAFDPDPIRGGKIVIQAKRYTNVVGIDAVRDLYGTVINEGATKGILITTSDYGPDSYDFAKGKPLTLLSGANLLHLLEKHGHKAKIDLKEAKRLLAERENG